MGSLWRRIVRRLEYPELDLINRTLFPGAEMARKAASYGLSFDGYWRLTDEAKIKIDVLWSRFRTEVETAPDGPSKDAWRKEFADLVQDAANIDQDYEFRQATLRRRSV
jgi:hypothetical protein